MNYFIQVDVGVMKRHVIHSIRDETKRCVPDDVFLQTRA
jgi:hypothetical protein